MTDEKIMATIKPDGECWQPELEQMPRKQLEELHIAVTAIEKDEDTE